MANAYKTILREAGDEFTEKRSRFIGTVAPAVSEAEAMAFIDTIRQRYWDASTNAYAFSLREGQTRRYSDDGEPQGKAGVPALEVLLRQEIVDAVVVVTRYYGGVQLGGGGLIRAFGHGAKIAVDRATVVCMQPCVELLLPFGYDWYGKIQNMMARYPHLVLDTDFSAEIRLHIRMPEAVEGRFIGEITELSAATIAPAVTGRCFADIQPET